MNTGLYGLYFLFNEAINLLKTVDFLSVTSGLTTCYD